MAKQTPIIMLIRQDVHKLEYDPATQYRFNFMSAWFWFLCMIAVPWVPAFRTNLLSLLIMEASLWANFATHFGAMSAALAAKQTSQTSTNGSVKNPTAEQFSYSAPNSREMPREMRQAATNEPAEFDA